MPAGPGWGAGQGESAQEGGRPMRARLVFTLIAVGVVVGLVAWGFVPRGASKQAASHVSRPARPTQSAHPVQSSSLQSPSLASRPSSLPRGWRLTLNASFRGSRLDSSLWGTCYPWMDVATGCTNFANVKLGKESEWYLPSQVRVQNNALQLVAQRMPTPGRNSSGGPEQYSCRSGMVTTYPGFRMKYGYVEVVAHIPPGGGLWPALWLAASNLRWPPEIDLLEHWGIGRQTTGVYFHPSGAPQLLRHVQVRHLGVGWHSFAILWKPSELTWYIDGYKVMTTQTAVPQQSMYFVANLAAVKPPRPNWGCEGTMSIRSVQVWQQ
jgi:hypothetical protein